MKKILTLLALALPISASAATLELGGYVSYDSFSHPDEPLTGPSFVGVLTSSVYNLGGGTDLKLGVNLGYQNVSRDHNNVEEKVTDLYLGGLVGLDVALTSRVHVQNLLGYDFGMSGEYEAKQNNLKVSRDLDSLRRLHYGVTALFKALPNLDVGGGVRWFQGHWEWEDDRDESYYQGFQFLATVMVPVM